MAFRLTRTVGTDLGRPLVRARTTQVIERFFNPHLTDRNAKMEISTNSAYIPFTSDKWTILYGKQLEQEGHTCVKVTNVFPLTLSYCQCIPCVNNTPRE